jgi:hypothetical protein
LPEGVDPAVHESAEVMKASPAQGDQRQERSIPGHDVPECPFRPSELDALYDQYITLQRTIVFEKMTTEKIAELILAVKKKEKAPSDFFTWELAAIGRSFLEEVLLQGKRTWALIMGLGLRA